MNKEGGIGNAAINEVPLRIVGLHIKRLCAFTQIPETGFGSVKCRMNQKRSQNNQGLGSSN